MLVVDLVTVVDWAMLVYCRHGLLFFIAVNTMFNNVAAIEIFIAERVIFV